jgi:hypothetical protein
MPKKHTFTIVMAYYENGTMLDRHMAEWAGYREEDKSFLKAIIVDDGSPSDPAKDHIKDVGFPVELYRIGIDIPWNQNGARNLGMTHADDWCLMTDIDHLLTGDMVYKIQIMPLDPDKYYLPARRRAVDGLPYKRHPNSYIINRELFWKVGGYDESYAGYYGTDSTFRRHIARVGERVELDDIILTLYGREVIPDASTTQYGRKDSKYYISHNVALAVRKERNPKPIPPLNFPWVRVI